MESPTSRRIGLVIEQLLSVILNSANTFRQIGVTPENRSDALSCLVQENGKLAPRILVAGCE